MKNHFQFRSRLASGGEILAQQATFLPVQTARPHPGEDIYTSELEHLASFLPIFNINGKKFMVAQPLLKEELR
jgi:hypothetical protein